MVGVEDDTPPVAEAVLMASLEDETPPAAEAAPAAPLSREDRLSAMAVLMTQVGADDPFGSTNTSGEPGGTNGTGPPCDATGRS